MLNKIGIVLFILFFVVTNAVSFSQPVNGRTISGFVYDQATGEALIGANVFIKEEETGSSTNNSGFFSVPGLPDGEYTMIISYIGYKTESLNISVPQKKEQTLTINLIPEALVTGEVVVTADSVKTIDKLFVKPVSKIELNAKQVNAIPRVIEADLLRALQTLPGITALSDFSSALYVRGGTPDQNLYLIDGTDVYNPEHAFGIFSTFNTSAIKKVEVSKGGFGAEYGGRLSSVLHVTNLDGNRNYFEGTANVSMLSASATLQMPLGKIGSLSGSIRRTYIDQTYAKWIKEVPDYYFYDGNLKAFFDLGERDKLSISYFHGKDVLDFQLDKEKESFSFDYSWGNTTGSINWRHIFNPKLFANIWLTASVFKSDFDFESVNFGEKNSISDYAAKIALEYYLTTKVNFKLGLEQKMLSGYLKQDWEGGRVDVERDRSLSTGYISSNFKPAESLDIEAGLRMQYFSAERNFFNIEPRFSVKYRLTEESNIKLAAGKYHQYLNRIPRLFFASIWTTADEYTNASSSSHYILGYQRALGAVYEFEVEAYYKSYKDLYVFNPNLETEVTPGSFDNGGRPVYNSTKGLLNRGDGESFGLEFILRKDIGALTGWVSYSLSKTNYSFDKLNQTNYFTPRHDRASVVNAVLNLDIKSFLDEIMNRKHYKSSSKWLLGLNFVYATGQPITVPASAYYVNTLPDWNSITAGGMNNPGYNLYPGTINDFRLPAYTRMDISLTYEINYSGWSLAPYLQVFNIGNRKNLWFIDYNEEIKDGIIVQEIDKVNMLPILPSLGVNIKF
ncbi:MAG TPA: carboxypeptidase-like regulatory domain-containing protein [Ignavibacteriaceae bacterium]|jgi:hypothetical protein|nr:carboxypeptidase-like regulatory domain-containing protein [Ignavibacteriaceae bacterium]